MNEELAKIYGNSFYNTRTMRRDKKIDSLSGDYYINSFIKNGNEKLSKTREELNKAHKNFEYAEGDLIDFYTYQIMALESKLDYLTKLAKLKNIDFNYTYQKVI